MDGKMKNVLMLCDAFPPAFNPRMGYLCKYLAKYGWKPVIIAEYAPQNIYSNLSDNQDVTYINYYCSENRIWQQIKYVFVFLADFLFNYKEFVIYRKAKKIIKTKNIAIILASSFRTFPMLSTQRLSRKYQIPLMVDLRDIFEQSSNNELVSKRLSKSDFINNLIAKSIRKKLLYQRNKILKNADAVTTISEWHAETLSKYNQNVNLIYNGFDAELFFPQPIENELFTITFTGRLHSMELRNPSLLFETAAHLAKEKKIDTAKFRLQFYLMDKKSKLIVKTFAETHKIAHLVDIFDTVPSTEIPKILNSSSILLLLANNSTGEKSPKGIMGTKLFEYLAVEKPILCVRSDEDCLEKTINSANAGLAASSMEEVEKFILEKFADWQQNGHTHQSVNQSFTAQFSREYQAKQFADLFNQIMCQ
ncbi:MAG: glycosyltransferase [Lentimicrobiaceae bacterium]|nr:glycosyltransferase [Lentimicrobiaceae bacterium]